MQVSRDTGLLTMMHAENGPAIDVLAAQLVEQGKTDPYYHGIARAWQMEEEATHRAIMLAEPHRRPALRRARQRQAGRRADRLGPRQRPERLRRDLSAVPVPVARGAARRLEPGVGRLRGREVGLLDAAALPGRGPPGPHVAGAAHQRPADGLDRPLPVLHEGPEGPRPRRLPQDPERHRLDRAPHGPDVPGRRHRRAHARALGRAHEHDPGPHVRAVRPEGRHPARGRRRHRALRPERPHDSASARARRTT